MTPTSKIGHGYDLHRIQPSGTLWMAGIAVSDQMSAIAHSDGDVVIHAIVDALLGAMGWGDIGEHFPDTDPQWSGAPSRLFLEEIFGRIKREGWRIGNVDVTILAEKPRLKPFKTEMVRNLTEILGGQINIKAGTNEKCDAIGRGEAVAAHAVALLIQ